MALSNRLQPNCPLDTSKYSVLPAAIWRNYDASSTLIQHNIYNIMQTYDTICIFDSPLCNRNYKQSKLINKLIMLYYTIIIIYIIKMCGYMLRPIISPSSVHSDNIKFKITTTNFIYVKWKKKSQLHTSFIQMKCATVISNLLLSEWSEDWLSYNRSKHVATHLYYTI